MAEFEVCELEGMRWVRIRIQDETVRAEAGALSHMQGDIRMTARPPTPLGAIRSAISEQAMVRPSYTGSGSHQPRSLAGRLPHLRGRGRGVDPFARRVLGVRGRRGARPAPRARLDLALDRRRVHRLQHPRQRPRPRRAQRSRTGRGGDARRRAADGRGQARDRADRRNSTTACGAPRRSCSRSSPAKPACGCMPAPARRWSAGRRTGISTSWR